MVIVGKSEAAIIMIQDILSSNEQYPVLEIINNLQIKPTKDYSNSGFKVIEKETWGVCADGYVLGALQPKTKKTVFENFSNIYSCKEYINIIHKSAFVSINSHIGNGCLIDACYIAGGSVIGNFVTCYSNSVIQHDCLIGGFVTICPSVSLGGNVEVGEGTLIGIGACVKNGVKIGSNCVVGAGSVVVKDVPNNSVVKGNPAK